MKGKFVIRENRSSGSAILSVIVCLCCAVIATGLSSSPAGAEQGDGSPVGQFGFTSTVPDEVWDAATRGLEPFLHAIPAQMMENYGFPAGGDFEEITLGQPYRIMTIHPNKLFAFAGGDDIQSIITSTQMWLFPVVQRGQPRALLTIDQMDGEWRAVSIGCARIARELNQFERTWADEQGYERCFVRVFQATSDIMLIIKDGRIGIIPFESAMTSLRLGELDKDATGLFSVTEIVERLIPVVRESVELY